MGWISGTSYKHCIKSVHQCFLISLSRHPWYISRWLFVTRWLFLASVAWVMYNLYKTDRGWRDTPTNTIIEIRSCVSQSFDAYFIPEWIAPSMGTFSWVEDTCNGVNDFYGIIFMAFVALSDHEIVENQMDLTEWYMYISAIQQITTFTILSFLVSPTELSYLTRDGFL